MPPLAIDHAVIAVRDLERAARDFTALGFTLTPLGQHSIGSRNRCIMFAATYVELLEPSGEHPWLEYYRSFVKAGDGLAALALATPDAEASYRELLAQGVKAPAPMDLARPVRFGEEERLARFRIVQLSREAFLCQHLTRELVWRREWQWHANGARELSQVDVTTATLRIEGLAESAAVQLHGVKLARA